jgi:hypothetical protein
LSTSCHRGGYSQPIVLHNMNDDPDTQDSDAGSPGELSEALELEYMAGTLSPARAAEVEAALAGSPQHHAKLQRVRARVLAMSSPDKTREITERLERELAGMGKKEEIRTRSSPSHASAWQILSAAVRELLDVSFPIPAFGAAPDLCHTEGSGASLDFAYPPDGSLEIKIISPEPGDEGAFLDVEIQPLPVRRVQLVRSAPASFEVVGSIVLTSREQRQLPAEKTVILREAAPAK